MVLSQKECAQGFSEGLGGWGAQGPLHSPVTEAAFNCWLFMLVYSNRHWCVNAAIKQVTC